jgi:hypothetical protein
MTHLVIVGGSDAGISPFEGTLGTQVVKVCNLVIARTG